MNQLDALPNENVVIKRQGEPESRVSGLHGHVRVGQVINFNSVGKKSDALPVSVSVSEDDDTMAKCG